MKTATKFILVFILFTFICNLSAQPPESPLKRGMNFSGWFEWISDASQIPFKKYTREDFENIQFLGCDHVRLPIAMFNFIGPGPDYTFDPLLLNLLDYPVDWAEELGIYLIIDNHSFDVNVNTTTGILDTLLAVWTQIAERYKDRSSYILYEVLNEPHGIDDTIWNNMQGEAIETIRQIDTKHTIVVGGSGWNGYNNLKLMPEYNDPNLIYTFHFYDSFLFTHQGASWSDMDAVQHIPFPYDASRMPEMPGELAGTWMGSLYENYPTTGTSESMESLLQIAVDFGTERQVPLLCGEMGVYNIYSEDTDKAEWFRIVRTICEANHIAWTVWDYKGTFGIFKKDGGGDFRYDVSVPIVEALGLNVPPQTEREDLPDSSNIILYDDFIPVDLTSISWMSNGQYSYLTTDFPYAGDYCIRWTGGDQYSHVGFRFNRIRDFSYLIDSGFRLDFWVKCQQSDLKLDVRFVDSNTEDPNDHPWRSRITLGEGTYSFTGEWQHFSIPLSTFTEQGAWEDNTWYNPQGLFDWSHIEIFQIVAEHQALGQNILYFDEIKIIDPNPTLVEANPSDLPQTFHIYPAYPNPFNSQARLTFELPQKLHVQISVYNIAGQVVDCLANRFFEAGMHSLVWDAAGFPSGLYFVRFDAGRTSLVRRLVLMK